MYAKEVSKSRRVLQCVVSAAWILFAGGPIFGFAALKPVLVAEKVYESLCDVSSDAKLGGIYDYTLKPDAFASLTMRIVSKSEESRVAKCTAQDLKLNMMFTVAAVLTNVTALLIGRILDKYGPRVCGLTGAFFIFLSCLIFIFSKQITESSFLSFMDPYMFGYSFLALGGPFTYISSFHLSNSFPNISGTILAILIGAFDTSSALFLVYELIYTHTEGTFTFSEFFKVFLLVPIFIAGCQILLMPKDSYKTPVGTTLCENDVPTEAQREITETDPLLPQVPISGGPNRRDSLGDALKQVYAQEDEHSLIEHTGGVFGILHGYSASLQISTPWFYLMCIFAAVQMLKMNYFVATIASQYLYLFHSTEKAEFITKVFDVALPLGGLLSVPFVGLFVDSVHTVTVLGALVGLSLVIGICGLFGVQSLALINVLMFVVYRPFFYTSVSDYCAKVFGFDTFGTVYGLIISISGLCNLFQSNLDNLTHSTFKMNPIPVNIFLIAATFVFGVIIIVYVYSRSKLYSRKSHINDTPVHSST